MKEFRAAQRLSRCFLKGTEEVDQLVRRSRCLRVEGRTTLGDRVDFDPFLKVDSHSFRSD